MLKGEQRRVRRHPTAVAAAPRKPDRLGEDASRVWDEVTPELLRLGLLSRLDGPVLEMFCTSYERWLHHSGGTGYASLTAVLRGLAHELGLSPGSRLRLPVSETDGDDVEAAIFGVDRPVS